MNNLEKPEIKTEIPGPKAEEIIKGDRKIFMTPTWEVPVVIDNAEGIVVEDIDGNKFYDFTSGIAVLNLGHSHPEVVKAIKKQSERFTHYAHCDFYYKVASKLGKKLKENTPGGENKRVAWGNSGSEANEAALKLMKKEGRKRFIAFGGGFHGRTHASLSLTSSKSEQQKGFFPDVPGVEHIPYPNPYRNTWKVDGYEDPDELINRVLEYIEEQVFPHAPPQDIAAIVFEPIQGEGGYVVPPKKFFKEMKKLADEHGIMLSDDEVQMGIGRTGEFWGIENFDVEPDVIQTAKALANGLPLGATIFNEELDYKETGRHASTFAGNPIACAVGSKVVDTVKDNLDEVKEKGEYLNKRLKELQEKHDIIGDVRGIGLAQGTEFVKDRSTKEPATDLRNEIVENALKKGLVLVGCGTSSIRYIPPLTIEKEEIDIGIEILNDAIKDSL